MIGTRADPWIFMGCALPGLGWLEVGLAQSHRAMLGHARPGQFGLGWAGPFFSPLKKVYNLEGNGVLAKLWPVVLAKIYQPLMGMHSCEPPEEQTVINHVAHMPWVRCQIKQMPVANRELESHYKERPDLL